MAAVKPLAASGRTPPHSLAAEQAVLGGVMMSPSAWDRLGGTLSSEDFYEPVHRTLFKGIEALAADKRPPDYVHLIEWLTSRSLLNEAGGRDYLASLSDNVPSAANVLHYARIVKDTSMLRQLNAVCSEIAARAYDPEAGGVEQKLVQAEQDIFKLGQHRLIKADHGRPLKELLGEVLERIEKPPAGLDTGFTDFDELVSGGLGKGELIIIAGRPAMGKSALAINIAEHAAVKDKRKVVVFSMEMSSHMLATRILSSMARVDQQLLRTGKLQGEDWTRLAAAATQLQEAPIYIDDTPALSPALLASLCRRMASELNGLDLVIVDYLQMMRVPGMSDKRVAEISEISRSLKELAKELNVPVVALSQLNRSVEHRNEHRPMMSDLRESGAIEQDADLIVFIYRDEVYEKDNSKHKGQAELIIGKQRNGPIGTALLAFLGRYTRFENLAKQDYSGHPQDFI